MPYQVSARNGCEQRWDAQRVANVVRGVGSAMDGPKRCAWTVADFRAGPVEIEEGFIAQKTCDGKPYLHSAARRAKMRREREESGCSGRNDNLWNWNDALWVLIGESGSEPKKKAAGLADSPC